MKDLRGMRRVSGIILLVLIGYLVVLCLFEPRTMTDVTTVRAESVGVYWNADCTRPVQSIIWGTLYPGSSKTANIYLKNEGKTAMLLSLATADWKPAKASAVMSLHWNCSAQKIGPNSIIPVELTLSLSPSTKAITTFSFSIVISASESTPPTPPAPQSPSEPPPVDNAPPSISITSPESGAMINSSKLLVTWVGRDSGSGIDSYSVYLNGALETRTENTTYHLPNLVVGSNNVEVEAYDKAGNAAKDEINVTVDTTLPAASICCQEGDHVRETVKLIFSASDLNLAKVLLHLDSDVFNVTGRDSYIWNTSTVDDGAHTVQVTAYDEAGNANSSSITLVVDNTPPTASISCLGGNMVRDIATVSLPVSDDNLARADLQIEDEVIDVTGMDSYLWNTSDVDDGNHTLKLIVIDKAGNAAEDETAVIVDNTLPEVSVSCLEGDMVRSIVTIDISASDANLADVFLNIDGDIHNVTGANSYLWNTSAADDGTHTIKVTAYDQAGNTNSCSTTILVDNTKPLLTVIGPTDGAVVRNLLNVGFHVFDISSVNVAYALDGSAFVDITHEKSIEIETRELGDGPHTVRFVVTDAVGNLLESNIRVIVDNTLPSLDLIAPFNGSYLRDVATIVLRGNDTNLDVLRLYTSGELAEEWHTGGPKQYTLNTSRYKDGVYHLKAVICDKAGNAREKSLQVIIDNTAPNVSILSTPIKGGVIGQFTILYSASDLNLAEVFLYIDNNVFNVTGGNSYTWQTLEANDGEHIVKIRTVDKAGNVAESQIAVTTINRYVAAQAVAIMALLAFILYASHKMWRLQARVSAIPSVRQLTEMLTGLSRQQQIHRYLKAAKRLCQVRCRKHSWTLRSAAEKS